MYSHLFQSCTMYGRLVDLSCILMNETVFIQSRSNYHIDIWLVLYRQCNMQCNWQKSKISHISMGQLIYNLLTLSVACYQVLTLYRLT